jgi:hypothetical protein
MTTTKTRSGLNFSNRYTVDSYSSNVLLAKELRAFSLPFGERLISSGHKWPVKPGTIDSGGGFSHQMFSWPSTGLRYVDVKSSPVPVGAWWQYKGYLAAYAASRFPSAFPTLASAATLNALGTTAISRVSPTNPLNGLGQFLGELRQLPTIPRIKEWKKITKNFRKLARKGSSEYLNAQFGWVPFVSEILNVAQTAMKHGAYVKQLDRDSGRIVRRRYSFPDDSNTTVTNLGTSYGSPDLNSYLYDAPGQLSRTSKTTTKRWFSGAFTYYVPPANSPKLIDRLKRAEFIAKRLYGARVNPQLVYQLAPWSWALGWVTNAGDIVNNLTNFTEDGLVMRYGYIMSETTLEETYSLVGLKLKNQSPITLSQSFTTKVKQRARATPFGFGLNASSFNLKQWSIIAALGISKAPRSLNF